MKVYLKINRKNEKYWFYLLTKQGEYHSIHDKPSVWEFVNKKWYFKSWYKNGLCHRETGPAIIWYNGYLQYWLNGDCYYQDKQEWEQELQKLKEANKKEIK